MFKNLDLNYISDYGIIKLALLSNEWYKKVLNEYNEKEHDLIYKSKIYNKEDIILSLYKKNFLEIIPTFLKKYNVDGDYIIYELIQLNKIDAAIDLMKILDFDENYIFIAAYNKKCDKIIKILIDSRPFDCLLDAYTIYPTEKIKELLEKRFIEARTKLYNNISLPEGNSKILTHVLNTKKDLHFVDKYLKVMHNEKSLELMMFSMILSDDDYDDNFIKLIINNGCLIPKQLRLLKFALEEKRAAFSRNIVDYLHIINLYKSL